jgi:hypothetical protein
MVQVMDSDRATRDQFSWREQDWIDEVHDDVDSFLAELRRDGKPVSKTRRKVDRLGWFWNPDVLAFALLSVLLFGALIWEMRP